MARPASVVIAGQGLRLAERELGARQPPQCLDEPRVVADDGLEPHLRAVEPSRVQQEVDAAHLVEEGRRGGHGAMDLWCPARFRHG